MVCENIQYIYTIYKMMNSYIFYIYFSQAGDWSNEFQISLTPGRWGSQTLQRRWRHFFLFWCVEKIVRYLSEAKNLWRWREHVAVSAVVQGPAKKKQGITGQHIPWTGSLVTHPLHKVIYLFHSIETWIEKWPNIFLKNTEINLILYIHVSWCRIKLTIRKENNELSWGCPQLCLVSSGNWSFHYLSVSPDVDCAQASKRIAPRTQAHLVPSNGTCNLPFSRAKRNETAMTYPTTADLYILINSCGHVASHKRDKDLQQL